MTTAEKIKRRINQLKKRWNYKSEELTKEPVTALVVVRCLVFFILFAAIILSFLYIATPLGDKFALNLVPGNWLWPLTSDSTGVPQNLVDYYIETCSSFLWNSLEDMFGPGLTRSEYLYAFGLNALQVVISGALLCWIFYRAVIQMRIKVLIRPTLWLFIYLGWKLLSFVAFGVGLYDAISPELMDWINYFTGPFQMIVVFLIEAFRNMTVILAVLLRDGFNGIGYILDFIPYVGAGFHGIAAFVEWLYLVPVTTADVQMVGFVLFEFYLMYRAYRLFQSFLMWTQLHAKRSDKELINCGAVKILNKAKRQAWNLPANMKFYIVKDNQVNAFAHACDKVTLMQGTMNIVMKGKTMDERAELLGGVLGHELGHIVNHDIFAMSIAGTVVFLYSILINVAAIVLYLICMVAQFIPVVGIAARLVLPLGNLFFRFVIILLDWTNKFLDILTGRFRETAADKFACQMGYGKSLYNFLADYADDSEMTVLEKLRDPHPKTYNRLRRIVFWMGAVGKNNPSIESMRQILEDEKRKKQEERELKRKEKEGMAEPAV